MIDRLHPVQAITFWKTSKKEVNKFIKIYDQLADTPERKVLLDKLISWAQSEAASDQAYNDAENSPDF